MNEPISELIIANLTSRLAQITVDNGYRSNVTVERAQDVMGSRPAHEKLVVIEDDEEAVPQPQGAQNFETWNKDVSVLCFVMPAKDSTVPIDTHANRLAADVEKLIKSDRTFGGNAITCDMRGKNRFEFSDYYGIELAFTIRYRTSESDPYS
jgi:hypothetical protein